MAMPAWMRSYGGGPTSSNEEPLWSKPGSTEVATGSDWRRVGASMTFRAPERGSSVYRPPQASKRKTTGYGQARVDLYQGAKQQADQEAQAQKEQEDSYHDSRFETVSESLKRGKRQGQDVDSTSFSALRPDQQQLIRAQTQLWAAMQADKAESDAMTVEGRQAARDSADYKGMVSALFGEQNGSDRYSPRTVAALSQLGLGDKSIDLDEYLDGSLFLTLDEIKALPEDAPQLTSVRNAMQNEGKPTVQSANSKFASKMANTMKGSADVGALLQQGQNLLDTDQAKAYTFMKDRTPTTPNTEEVLKDLTSDKIEGLNLFMEKLASKSTDEGRLGQIYHGLQRDMGLTPQQIDVYVNKMLTNADRSIPGDDQFYSADEIVAKWGRKNA